MGPGLIILILFGCCIILGILGTVVQKRRGGHYDSKGGVDQSTSSKQIYTEQLNDQAKNNHFNRH